MDIEFRHFTYFVAVAEERSFNRGALRLKISQPTLMRQINELEAALEVKLLDRTPQGVTLTTSGQQFLNHARALLLDHQTMCSEIRALTKRRVRVGYLAPSLFGPVGNALALVRERFPGAAFELVEASPGQQIRLLLEGELEVGFIGHSQGDAPAGLRLIPLYKVPLAAVLSDTHRLASRQTLALSELKSETFIGLKEALFPGRQSVVAQTCRAAGLEITYRELADSLISLMTLIGHGQGVSLVPTHSASIAHPRTVFIPLQDQPTPHIIFHAAVREGEICTEITEFLRLCRLEDELKPV